MTTAESSRALDRDRAEGDDFVRRPGPRLPPAWLYPAVIAVLGVGLWAFRLWSEQQHRAIRVRFKAPPIYGTYFFEWSWYGWIAVGGVIVFALLTPRLLSPRLHTALFLPITAAVATVLSYYVNMTRGSTYQLLRVLCTPGQCEHYGADVAVLRVVGVHKFVAGFPHEYRPLMTSVENRTHPPGALVVWNWIVETFGTGMRAAWFMAACTMLVVVAAWLLGYVAGGDRVGRVAALLVAVAPATLLFGFTAMDGIYATLLSLSGACFLFALYRKSATLAALAGFALGMTSFVTYAAALIVVACGITTILWTRDPKAILRALLPAAAGGLFALVLLRVTVGFDLFASNSTVSRMAYSPRPLSYWAFGTPAVFLIFAGFATAGLALIGMVTRRPPMTIVVLVGMLIFADLPRTITGLQPGEIERTWLFVQPFFAAAAALAFVDWERVSRLVRQYGIAAIVALGGLSAVLIQAFYDTNR
ncbi:MAG: hypothetical protein JWL83_915 [Actinomycetia bacterium]|nr:hypothetical protein [Actinomycetes bacterium]